MDIKTIIPRYVELWKFPNGYEVETIRYKGGDTVRYEYEVKVIKPAKDEFPEKDIKPLDEIRAELFYKIETIGTKELFDSDKDWSALNKSLCKEYGFLEIGSFLDTTEFEELYKKLNLNKERDKGGIASLDVKRIWKENIDKKLKSYSEGSELWIELLRMIYYMEQISGRKNINEERLNKLSTKYNPLVQSNLNSHLRDVSPRVKWDDGSLYFQSSTLMGNILLYCLDVIHTRIQRCLGCGKFIPAERSTKKFCVKSGSCQKKFSRIRKEAENEGLVSFSLNGITFSTKSGKLI